MKSKGKNQVAATAAHGPYHYTVYFEPQTDGSFAVVFPAFPEVVAYGGRLDPPTSLADIKQSGMFDKWALVRQPRLSTMEAPDKFVQWMRARYPPAKI